MTDFSLLAFNTASGNPTESLNFNNLCGACGYPAKDHPVKNDPIEGYCYRDAILIAQNRTFVDTGDLNQYADLTSDGLLREDLSGPGSTTEIATDPWEVVYDASSDPETIDAYRDVNVDERTSATDYQYLRFFRPGVKNPHGKVRPIGPLRLIGAGSYEPSHDNAQLILGTVERHQTSLKVEGMDGFFSERLIDPLITQKFQERILNVYRDKNDQTLRVGSVRITYSSDGAIIAQCVRGSNCGRMTCTPDMLNDVPVPLSPAYHKRQLMETFIMNVIRHGNNHAAKWFTSRPEFYKVHADSCDLACASTEAHCAH